MGLGATVRRLTRRWVPRRPDLPPSTWGLDRDGAGALRLGPVALHELLARYGSPVHVVDAARLSSNAARFTSTRCEVFYSYKTNPVPGVLRLLHAAGLGAEVVSHYELWLALRLGVRPEAIVYNDPAKTAVNTAKLIDEDKVFALTGYVATGNLIAAMPLAEKAGVPMFAPLVGTSSFRVKTHRLLFHVRAGYDLTAAAILLCESDGTPEEVEEEIGRMSEVLRRCGATAIAVSTSEEERLKFWSGRKNAFPASGRISPD